MEKLNITFFTDSYLPAVDGVVTSILNFRKELEKRGHTVYVFAAGNESARRKYSKGKTFLYTSVKFKPYPQYNVALFPYSSIFKLRELDVDLVHAQTPMMMGSTGLLAGKLLGIPVIGSFHTMVNDRRIINAYYPKNPQIKKWTVKYMANYLRFFYGRCTSVIAPSETIRKILYTSRIRNVSVIPNSVDTKRFNPNANASKAIKRLGIKDDDKVVAYVGRISREKRLETMLSAAKILVKKDPKLKFVIIGGGPGEEHYKKLTRRLGLDQKVVFAGFIDREELPSYYASCDVFCMPSTFETQGIVSIEAMAVGKPVVGADYMATSEIVKNGYNGEKFRAGDYKACADKIEKVLNNPMRYKRGALETAKGFSTERMTDLLLDEYNLVLSQ